MPRCFPAFLEQLWQPVQPLATELGLGLGLVMPEEPLPGGKCSQRPLLTDLTASFGRAAFQATLGET